MHAVAQRFRDLSRLELLRRLVDDADSCPDDQQGLDRSRQVLELAMPIIMLLIRRYQRFFYRPERNECRNEIDT